MLWQAWESSYGGLILQVDNRKRKGLTHPRYRTLTSGFKPRVTISFLTLTQGTLSWAHPLLEDCGRAMASYTSSSLLFSVYGGSICDDKSFSITPCGASNCCCWRSQSFVDLSWIMWSLFAPEMAEKFVCSMPLAVLKKSSFLPEACYPHRG